MIRINLLPGGQRRRRAGGGIQFPSIGELLGKVREPLLMGAIASWVVGAGVVGALWFVQAGEVGELGTRLEQLEGQERRFRRMIAQKTRAVNIRDSLVAQLEAIREIDGDRYVWPHVLEEVTKALPDFTWLVSIDAVASTFDALADTTVRPPVRFTIDGRTSDISAYTRFVSQLTNSPWVRAAEFGPIQSVIEQGRPVQAFTVTVTYQQADPRFLRTVPLQGSVIQ
jgi:Tfp pilus assembly protein PilN